MIVLYPTKYIILYINTDGTPCYGRCDSGDDVKDALNYIREHDCILDAIYRLRPGDDMTDCFIYD